MKGFYFSLDALLAASVILGLMTMLISYNDRATAEPRNVNLDQVQTSLLQQVSRWNSSINSTKTVLGYIYYQHYSGNTSEAAETCKNYFQMPKKYAFYLGNNTDLTKICGDLKMENNANIRSEQIVAPDIMVNNTFKGLQNAILVVSN